MTNLISHIQAAFPRHPIKHLARGLGCSDRQAWRVVTTGKVAGRFRMELIKLLESAHAKNRAEIERLQRELKVEADAAMATVAEGEDRARH